MVQSFTSMTVKCFDERSPVTRFTRGRGGSVTEPDGDVSLCPEDASLPGSLCVSLSPKSRTVEGSPLKHWYQLYTGVKEVKNLSHVRWKGPDNTPGYSTATITSQSVRLRISIRNS